MTGDEILEQQKVEGTVLDAEQQLEQLSSKIERCIAVIDELRIEKQLLQEQVSVLTERNQRVMSAMQDLVKRLDDVVCQTTLNN